MSSRHFEEVRTPTARRSEVGTRRPEDGTPPRSRSSQESGFPLVPGVAQRIVLKKGRRPADSTAVATIARGTQLDLLHHVIETQRMVNAVPGAGGDRALEVVLERVQTVTNADGAAI